MGYSNEVEQIFPHHIGAEIESSLRTMKDLPESARGQINVHIANLISEKRTALAQIKDKPGNETAYFFIGLLFIWETARISIAGTLEERKTSATVQYRTPEGTTIMGFAGIGIYFFEKYKASGGNDPGHLQIMRTFGVQ